jgi:hypothetical protein
MDYITAFEQLVICIKGQSDLFFKQCFNGSLNEVIQAHVMMQCPKTLLEACDRAKGVEIVINAQTKSPLFTTHLIPLMVTIRETPPTCC